MSKTRPSAQEGEKLTRGEQDNKQFNEYVASRTPLANFHNSPDQVFSPHVLKDGANSAGTLGSFNRVYVNITLGCSAKSHSSTSIQSSAADLSARSRSRQDAPTQDLLWQATEAQTPNTALFFVATAKPDLPEECAWRREISYSRCRNPQSRQGGVRRSLRTMLTPASLLGVRAPPGSPLLSAMRSPLRPPAAAKC